MRGHEFKNNDHEFMIVVHDRMIVVLEFMIVVLEFMTNVNDRESKCHLTMTLRSRRGRPCADPLPQRDDFAKVICVMYGDAIQLVAECQARLYLAR